MHRITALRYWSDISPNALRLMIAVMILSALMMGVSGVSRVLFILRLGLGAEFFGIYNAFGAIGYMGMALPAGMLSSHLGLKRSMLLGVAVALLGFMLPPLVEYLPRAWWAVYLLSTQLLSAGGYAIFSVNASPAIMATTGPENRSKTYGMYSSSRNLGTLVGMLVGGALPTMIATHLGVSLDTTEPYRIALLSTSFLTVFSLWAVIRFRDVKEIQSSQTREPRDIFPILPMSLIVVIVIFSQGAVAVCHSFCNAYMDEELRLSPQFIGTLGALGQLCAVMIPITVPHMRKSLDNGMLLILSSVGSALMLVPMFFMEHWLVAGLGRMGIMATSAVWMPVIQMYQMEMVHQSWRPVAFALLSMALGLNYGIISFFGGYIIASWGYPVLFMISCVVTLVGSLILLVVMRRPIMRPQYAN